MRDVLNGKHMVVRGHLDPVTTGAVGLVCWQLTDIFNQKKPAQHIKSQLILKWACLYVTLLLHTNVRLFDLFVFQISVKSALPGINKSYFFLIFTGAAGSKLAVGGHRHLQKLFLYVDVSRPELPLPCAILFVYKMNWFYWHLRKLLFFFGPEIKCVIFHWQHTRHSLDDCVGVINYNNRCIRDWRYL